MRRPKNPAAEFTVYHQDIPAYQGCVVVPYVDGINPGDQIRGFLFNVVMPEATSYVLTPTTERAMSKHMGALFYKMAIGDKLDRPHGYYTGTGADNWAQIEENMGIPIQERRFIKQTNEG